MAGKNHHHVWQLLQRGFGEKLHGDHHIWVYEKGCKPRKTVTRKYGKEKYFYGPEGSVADTNITKFENSTQGSIQSWRNAETGSSIDPQTLAPIISHLEMRSMFLRGQMSNLSYKLLKTLNGYLASEKHAIKLFAAYTKNHPELIDEMLDEQGIFGKEERRIANIVAAGALPKATKAGAKEVSILVKAIFEPFLEGIAEIAKKAHIQALETSFTEASRTDMHLSFEYSVRRLSIANLILPDTILAFLKKDGCSPISQKGDDIEQVIFPISSGVAIIGKKKGSADRTDAALNKILASCAYREFVARANHNNFIKLASRIGRNAQIIKDSELKKMVSFDQLLGL